MAELLQVNVINIGGKNMLVNQLSVFMENKEGRLEQVLETLKEGNININSLSLAETADYGLLRMIVSDPEAGKNALKDKGFSAMLTPVLAVDVADEVGQLQVVLTKITQAGINIEYIYSMKAGGDGATIIIRTSDLDKTAEVLKV